MANRFEQVDEVANDAISVILEQRGDGQWARIYCPASAGDGVKQNRMSARAAPKDALSSAVKFANEHEARDRGGRSRQHLETGVGRTVSVDR